MVEAIHLKELHRPDITSVTFNLNVLHSLSTYANSQLLPKVEPFTLWSLVLVIMPISVTVSTGQGTAASAEKVEETPWRT